MIISSPNHCWCCHTQQCTAFPTGTSEPPSRSQFLPYHHLPRKLKSSQKGAGFSLCCCYLTAAGIQTILRMAFPRTQASSFSFVLCSQINRKNSRSRSTTLLEKLFTPATQTSKPCQNRHWNMITWVPRWRTFPALTMVAEKGRQRPALPSPMEPTACLTGCYLIAYTFTSPLFHELSELL